MGLGLNFSQYVAIDEHRVLLPKPTISKEEILFFDCKPEDAYWRRQTDYPQTWYDFIPRSGNNKIYTKTWQDATLYDEDGNLVSLNVDDSNILDRLLKREAKRRKDGVWFKNGNDLEYLTGHHYFILQWMKMLGQKENDGFGYYREYQRDHAYMIMHVWASQNILGMYVSKPKKIGWTQFHAGYYLNKALTTRGQTMGMMSKREIDAIDTNMRFFLYGYDNLPNILKPAVKSRTDEAKIVFGEKSKGFTSNSDALNTMVYATATKEAGFDAPVMDDCWTDELPKTDKESRIDPEKIFEKTRAACKMQSKFNGRYWISSYPPEETTSGFLKCKKIYNDSKLATIDELGRTKSQLICYHISSLNSYGTEFNKHGKCDTKRAFYLNDLERNQAKGDKNKTLAIIRQLARNEKEAWGEGNSSSTFDIPRLNELQDELEIKMATGEVSRMGKYEWTNALWEAGKKDRRPKGEFCPVRFIPASREVIANLGKEEIMQGLHGDVRVHIFEPIPQHIINIGLRMGGDDKGNLFAPNQFWAVKGIDPTDYADVEAIEKGSKNAMHTMIVHDPTMDTYMRKPATKILFSEYLYRPNNPREFYEDVVKEIIYTGCLVAVEANKAWLATMLIEEGLGRYLLVKNDKGVMCIWKPGMKYSLLKTVNAGKINTVEEGVKLVRSYLLEAMPDFNEIDYGKLLKTLRLLEQLKKFDPDNTKIYDLVMSFIYTIICHEHYLAILNKPPDRQYQANHIQAAMAALMRL